MSPVIEVEDLVKRYAGRTVVDSISFEVRRGEIFGVVGPNGAGKTTSIECVEGLRRPDGGRVRTLGLEPISSRRSLHARIGVQLQESSLPLRLEVREAVDLFASFHRHPEPTRELLERLDLWPARSTAFGKLSGGQRQRLFIALALVNRPELVFLDELTTGLDPHARRSTWRLVEEMRERGTTIFLSTHFMEEAERLCDRVAVIDRGRVVALDTPARLIESLSGGPQLTITTPDTVDLDALRAIAGVRSASHAEGRLVIEADGDGVTTPLLAYLAADGVRIRELRTNDGTLEDAFLALTGNPPEGETRCEA